MKLRDEPEVKTIAKELGLARFRDAEKAIREFCVQRIEEIIKSFSKINDLDQFLDVISSNLGIKFEEINDTYDFEKISATYVDEGELIFADLRHHFDANTDAILISLRRLKGWKYVAVIDCREQKKWRAYFSKWHEIAHVLIDSPQLSFSFRKTPIDKKKPKEQMADRVAGDLAFYAPLFLPELLARIKKEKRVTFEIIEDLRQTVCKSASREATIRAAVLRSPYPQLMVIADYDLKAHEKRIVASLQGDLFPEEELPFKPKLRAVAVTGNVAASDSGLWIYRNMEVPRISIIFETYVDMILPSQVYSNIENLNWWKHSGGQLEDISIYVEAKKIGHRVFGLISCIDKEH